MNYSVEVTPRFEKEFKKLDGYTRRMIKARIDRNITKAPEGNYLLFSRKERRMWPFFSGIYRAGYFIPSTNCTDPRVHGKVLTANRKGQWRYRIGDYRLICTIEEDRLVILALSIGHRSEVYKD